MRVRVFDHFPADLDILLEGLVAGVNHDAGKSFINAVLAQLEGVPVIEVDGDRNIGEADGGLDELLQVNRVGILAGALGNLQHYRRLFLLAGLNDGLEQFHVVDVKRPQRVFALQRLGKQVFGMCQWHIVRFSVEVSLCQTAAKAATERHSRKRRDEGNKKEGQVCHGVRDDLVAAALSAIDRGLLPPGFVLAFDREGRGKGPSRRAYYLPLRRTAVLFLGYGASSSSSESLRYKRGHAYPNQQSRLFFVTADLLEHPVEVKPFLLP